MTEQLDTIIEQELDVSDPQDEVLQARSDRNLFLAGIGSGKSHIIAFLAAFILLNYPRLIQFIGANTYGQLSKSTLKRCFDVWLGVFNWSKGRDFVVDTIPPEHFTRYGAPLKSYENTICFANGAMIFTASLDNYKMIDGTEFAVAYLDETKDTKEEAVKEVITARLRQPGLYLNHLDELFGQDEYNENIAAGRWRLAVDAEGDMQLLDEAGRNVRSWNPLYIFTSPAKVDWLNLWFKLTNDYEAISKKIFSKTDFYHKATPELSVTISSTYHNQSKLPVGFIKRQLDAHAGNQNRIDMLIYGSPIAKAGGEFVPSFNRLEHVKRVEFNPDEVAHLTFDFNVVRYMSLLCSQLVTGLDGRLKLRVFKEYALGAPRNKTQAVCDAFLKDYAWQLFNGLYYYGDPAGKARQTVSTEYENNYDVIDQALAGYVGNYSDRVATHAPSIVKSRDFVNNLFEGVYGIDVEIDEGCELFIHDLEYTREGPDGKMLKPKYKDPLTKQTYERLGHLLDAFRYLVVQLLYDYYQQLLTSQQTHDQYDPED